MESMSMKPARGWMSLRTRTLDEADDGFWTDCYLLAAIRGGREAHLTYRRHAESCPGVQHRRRMCLRM